MMSVSSGSSSHIIFPESKESSTVVGGNVNEFPLFRIRTLCVSVITLNTVQALYKLGVLPIPKCF